jgi:hypothetical protein
LIDGSRALVQDQISELEPSIPMHWGMMTAASITLSPDGRTAFLSGAGRQMRVEMLEPSDAHFLIQSAAPPTSSENPNKGDSLLALETAPKRSPGGLRIAILFTPVGERWPHLPLPEVTDVADWH